MNPPPLLLTHKPFPYPLCLPLTFPQIDTQSWFITIHQVSLRHASLLPSLHLCQERWRRTRQKQKTFLQYKAMNHRGVFCVLASEQNIYYSCMHGLSSYDSPIEKSAVCNSDLIPNIEWPFVHFLISLVPFIKSIQIALEHYYLSSYNETASHPWKWWQSSLARVLDPFRLFKSRLFLSYPLRRITYLWI